MSADGVTLEGGQPYEIPRLPRSSGPFHGHPDGPETFHPIVLVVAQKAGRLSRQGGLSVTVRGAIEARTAQEAASRVKRERADGLDAAVLFAAALGISQHELFRVRPLAGLRGVVVARAFEQWIVAQWTNDGIATTRNNFRTIPGIDQALTMRLGNHTWPTRTPQEEVPAVATLLGAQVIVAEQGEPDANAEG